MTSLLNLTPTTLSGFILLAAITSVFVIAWLTLRVAEFRRRSMEIDRISGFRSRVVVLQRKQMLRAHGGGRG